MARQIVVFFADSSGSGQIASHILRPTTLSGSYNFGSYNQSFIRITNYPDSGETDSVTITITSPSYPPFVLGPNQSSDLLPITSGISFDYTFGAVPDCSDDSDCSKGEKCVGGECVSCEKLVDGKGIVTLWGVSISADGTIMSDGQTCR